MQPESTVTLMPDIHHGNAVILGTKDGWALPGRKHTTSKTRARKVCRRIANLMARAEVQQ